MNIDWAAFTPGSAAIGGVVIGLAAALLVLVNGRIAGISGIVGGMLRPRAGEFGWRRAFTAGLQQKFQLVAGVLYVNRNGPKVVPAGGFIWQPREPDPAGLTCVRRQRS